jgi:hypothetical protein
VTQDDKSDGQKKKKCTHCKFCGHNASKCRKLKKEQEEAKAKAGGDSAKPKSADASAKIAVAEEEPDLDLDLVRLFRMSQDLPICGDLRHQWIVDSGASRTMCSLPLCHL